MPPSETSAPPSYPARVVRYLSERRHALERGAVEREAYDAEVELVFERVLEDTARGCATKILTVNALREANLCDEKTAARYVTLCVGAHRRGGAPMPFREDDAIERDAAIGGTANARLSSATNYSYGETPRDAEPRARRNTEEGRARTTFENTRWHFEPGRDPWAFAYDEDTHVMREMEYLAAKSRAMCARARRAADARAGEAASAAASAAAAEARGRRVELGEDKVSSDTRDAGAGAGATDGTSSGTSSDATTGATSSSSLHPSEKAEKLADKKKRRTRRVLAATATSARRAEAAARDVARFAAELEKKYPFPRTVSASGDGEGPLSGPSPSSDVFAFEDGVLASWDDVDPRRPEEAAVPVTVHWTDVRRAPASEGGSADARVAPDEDVRGETVAETTLATTVSGNHRTDVDVDRRAGPSPSVVEPKETDDCVAAMVRAAVERVLRREEEEDASSRRGLAHPVDRTSDDSRDASASPPPERPGRVPARKALLVGCAYFAPTRPEMTRVRGALNDVASVREVLTKCHGFDADDPERTRVLIDRPVERKGDPRSFFGAFAGTSRGGRAGSNSDPDSSDDWKTGLAAPPRLRRAPSSAPTLANVRAGLAWLTRDAKAGDVLFFYFSGHATQVPSPVAETGELDGADEALCTVDTDWETCFGLTERDLVRDFFARVPPGATGVFAADAKHCGALRGSTAYRSDDAFVEASRNAIEAFPRGSDKRANAHDELFGRFVPPPKPVAARIAARAAEARAAPRETREARVAAAERVRRDVREAPNVLVALLGCDAAKGETCRETPCADGAVRGAFTEALCAALRSASGETVEADANECLARESLDVLARDAAALAAAAAAAARSRRETAFAVEKRDARAQTPIAVEARERAERERGERRGQ